MAQPTRLTAVFSGWSSLMATFAPCPLALAGGTPDFDQSARNVRATLSDLIAADTTNPPGNEARATAIIARRLRKEGIPYKISTFAPGRDNIVARLKGSGAKRPLLLLAHLDVVGTQGQEWNFPMHRLTERDGYLYGRGVMDDLGPVATDLETFISLKRSARKLDRDVILALTGDEESGGAGIRHLLANDRSLGDVELALNEGGAPILRDGKVAYIQMQTAEKTYQDFVLQTKGESGHSSVPKGINAIDRLAQALARLASHEAERRLIPVTRAYFKELAQTETPPLNDAMSALASSKDVLPAPAVQLVEENPSLASLLRTTCVATMISGGMRENALPVSASANINCRILPDGTVEQVRDRIRDIIADPHVEITLKGLFGSAPASEISGPVLDAIQYASRPLWPGALVLPMMSNSATDSRFLRARGIQAYGVFPFPLNDSDRTRAHGVDERVPSASVRPGVEYYYRLVEKLAGA